MSSAAELRAKPQPRAKLDNNWGRGLGEHLPIKFLIIHTFIFPAQFGPKQKVRYRGSWE